MHDPILFLDGLGCKVLDRDLCYDSCDPSAGFSRFRTALRGEEKDGGHVGEDQNAKHSSQEPKFCFLFHITHFASD